MVARIRCLAGLALLVAAGCASPDPAVPIPDGAVSCDPPTLTYQNFGSAFFSAHCAGCHLWDQPSARDDAAQLSGAVGSGFMPPGGGVPDDEKAAFLAWLGCGAP
jgi:hypothetical protein